MAVAPDVVVSVLEDLWPKYENLFSNWHPLMEKLYSNAKGAGKTLEGYKRTFTTVSGGPGNVTTIRDGDEVINGGLTQKGKKGEETAARLIYAFDVPGKTLDEANNKNDLAQIIKDYPELAIADFSERLAAQIATGNGSEVGSFITLNGDTTYQPDDTALYGMFQFADKASQNRAFHNIMREGGTNGVVGWYNQFGEISSFAVDGLEKLRHVFWKASRQGKFDGGIDLILADEATYENYVSRLTENVRVAVVKNDTAGVQNVRQGIMFQTAEMFLEDAIDTTSSAFSTTAAQSGVAYMLNTRTFQPFNLSKNPQDKGVNFMKPRGFHRLPGQDVWRYEILHHASFSVHNLRANGVVVGGGRP
jgi:hypothetical protein